MSVSTVLNHGVDGFNRASQDIQHAAENISRASFEQTPEQSVSVNQAANAPKTSSVNITEEAINLRIGELNAKANTQSIRTADDVLGTLIDIRA